MGDMNLNALEEKQPVSTLFSKVLNTLSYPKALPPFQPLCNTLCVTENRLNTTLLGRRRPSTQLQSLSLDHENIRGASVRRGSLTTEYDTPKAAGIDILSQLSLDSTEELSNALPTISRLHQYPGSFNSTESGPPSRASPCDELDQQQCRAPRRLSGLNESQRGILADHEEEYDGFMKLRTSTSRTSFNNPLNIQNEHYRFQSKHSSHCSSLPGSRRGSAQNSPARNRGSLSNTPLRTRLNSGEVLESLTDGSELRVKIIEALQRGKFSNSPTHADVRRLSGSVTNSSHASPSLTPLLTPSPMRASRNNSNFPAVSAHIDSVSTPHSYTHVHDTTKGMASIIFDSQPGTASSLKTSKPIGRRSLNATLSENSFHHYSDRDSVDVEVTLDMVKMSCNRTKEEMSVRADERNRRRSEVLSRREERRGSDADKTESVALSLQEKSERGAKKIANTEAEFRRHFWTKVISLTSVGNFVTKNLEQQLIDRGIYKIKMTAARVITRMFVHDRTRRVAAIRKILFRNLGSVCMLFAKLVSLVEFNINFCDFFVIFSFLCYL